MAERRLVLVTGKGGTGKSAVAAAISLCAHRSGRRVLGIAMSAPGGGLGSHLGAPPLAFEPQEVRPGLSVLTVDRSKAMVEYLQTQIGLPPFMAFGPAVRAFDALASAAPAVREIITIGKVLFEVRRGTWDLVVADAPPTGQIGSYLRAARTITDLVPSGRIREQAGWMQDLMSDSAATALVVVTLAEELPASETAEFLQWLGQERVTGRTDVFANRILPPLEVEGDVPSGKAGDAARLHLSLVEEQQRWLDVVPADLELAFQFGLFTPAEVAAHLADEVSQWWEQTG